MTGARCSLAVAAAACSPRPRPRAFPVGFLAPVSPRVAAAASRAGLLVAVQAPAGAATVSAAVPPLNGSGEVTADWSRLRFLAALAIAKGASGIFFLLPETPAGRDYLEYAEESQSVDRVVRALLAMRPILEGGAPAPAFAVPGGVEARAWTFRGRRYVLLVNPSADGLPLDEASLEPWRALFAVRSDPRYVLSFCGSNRCLPAGGVLWLEGRLSPEL